MKLLLTSAGFTNESIVNALKELAQKPFGELNFAFIPTAANVEDGDKGWLIDDLATCKKLGFKIVDIVDISALPQDVWEKRLRSADILMFGGGNAFHLNYWLEKSGLKDLLPELLKEKVYVGLSAGSIVTAKTLSLSQAEKFYSEEIGDLADYTTGLGFVSFHVRPHLNSPHFPDVTVEAVGQTAKEVGEPVYVIDDNTAIKVVDDKVDVVSEGKWERFN